MMCHRSSPPRRPYHSPLSSVIAPWFQSAALARSQSFAETAHPDGTLRGSLFSFDASGGSEVYASRQDRADALRSCAAPAGVGGRTVDVSGIERMGDLGDTPERRPRNGQVRPIAFPDDAQQLLGGRPR